MRNILLTSTAAVCLILAGQVANAQSDHKKQEQKVERSQQAPAAKHTAEQKHRAGTTGQSTDEKKNDTPSAAQNKDESASKADEAQSKSKSDHNKSANEQKPNEAAKSNSENKSTAADTNKAGDKAANEKNASDKNANDKAAADKNANDNKSNAANDQNNTKSATDQNKANEAAKPAAAQAPTNSNDKNASAPASNDTTNANNQTNNNTNVNATNQKNGQRNAANVNVTQNQKVKISERIQHEHLADPVRNLSISITVGQRVPRHIHVHPVPQTIVTIAPEYRGYDYFTTEQDVVIVSPRTHEIVSTIPRDVSRARAEAGGGSSTTVSSVSGGGNGAMPCQVMERTASGDTRPMDASQLRETTGSGGGEDRLAVTVQAPNGQDMPQIALPQNEGRIVAETDGSGCRIIVEPGRTGR